MGRWRWAPFRPVLLFGFGDVVLHPLHVERDNEVNKALDLARKKHILQAAVGFDLGVWDVAEIAHTDDGAATA